MKHPAFSFAVLVVLLLIASALRCSAATVYVKWDSPGPTFDGTSWDTAFHRVQPGLDVVRAGDEIWIARGRYVEHITLESGVALYAGFAGTETSRDERTPGANTSILDGGGSGIVVYASSINSARIDGFTIRNGSRSGIICHNSSVTIVNNTIAGNSGFRGAGISCNSSTVTITNNTIVQNSALDGAGIYYSDCSPTISNNIVAFNSSGICKDPHGDGTPVLRNNCVYGNWDYDYSGLSPGTGDISEYPHLVDRAHGNMHIMPGSPCIDAGWNDAPELPAIDIDGHGRIQGGFVDIGSDESDGTEWTAGPYVVVRVSPSGDDANDGSSWALAKRTVQAGIDSASMHGGQVWVAEGIYNECIRLNAFAYVSGGFAGTESAMWERSWAMNETVLDGSHGIGNSVVTAIAGYQVSGIDGFTITGARRRCGIECTLSSPTISNNKIVGNVPPSDPMDERGGGGISCYGSSPLISNNTITGNGDSTRPGGGIHCINASSPLIWRNTVTDNMAETGGGIFCSYSSPTVANNTIVGNNAYGGGGGVYCERLSSPIIVNNVIAQNGSWSFNEDGGGGIACYGVSSEMTIVNNTIAGNHANRGGGIDFMGCSPAISNNIIAFNSSGMSTDSGSIPVLRNNCVYGNTGYDYSHISAGTGDISLDPLLVDRASGDYHLTASSPCIDAGWNDAPGLPATDMNGEPRIMNCIVDIGADEYAFGTALSNTKPARDTAPVWLNGYIVTATFDGFFYIEAEDRSCGIRVEKAGHGAKAGDKVNVTGILKTNADGERYIEASSVEVTGTGSIKPLHINSRALGGSDWLYNPVTGAGQCGVVDGLGLNTIALLVTTWGKLNYLGGGYSLDKTARILTEGMSLGGKDTYVRITGISSCYREADGLHPTIRVTEIKPL